ncbi:40S ribosomal protein S24-A [Perkinsela sp. CCAP 1560/4]|nr:40S ribosomal protein S24-A [Perkinsela sp. CCAP 1560/4]|eukprot:KNH07016.1 40S ribosomal protein S24-A [Perkinsela sp. CCAP 1560/4]
MVARTEAPTKFVLHTRKFSYNPLLSRKQMALDITMPPNKGTIPKKDIRSKVRELYKVVDENTISIFGFKNAFGGGKVTGFCLIYDNIDALKKYEPNYRLLRIGLGKKRGPARKGIKEKKNKKKKLRGKNKVKQVAKKK